MKKRMQIDSHYDVIDTNVGGGLYQYKRNRIDTFKTFKNSVYRSAILWRSRREAAREKVNIG